jgi:hypothetical protein
VDVADHPERLEGVLHRLQGPFDLCIDERPGQVFDAGAGFLRPGAAVRGPSRPRLYRGEPPSRDHQGVCNVPGGIFEASSLLACVTVSL